MDCVATRMSPRLLSPRECWTEAYYEDQQQRLNRKRVPLWCSSRPGHGGRAFREIVLYRRRRCPPSHGACHGNRIDRWHRIDDGVPITAQADSCTMIHVDQQDGRSRCHLFSLGKGQRAGRADYQSWERRLFFSSNVLPAKLALLFLMEATQQPRNCWSAVYDATARIVSLMGFSPGRIRASSLRAADPGVHPTIRPTDKPRWGSLHYKRRKKQGVASTLAMPDEKISL